MRIGLIADIHGLLPPLDAVLAEMEALGVEEVVCLGDVAYGPQPTEVLRRVRALGCPVIMGNTDARLLDPTIPASLPSANAWARRMSEWCNTLLTDGDRAYIRSFVPTLTRDLGRERLLCFHGSPRSYFDEIYATTSDDQLDAFFAGTDATIFAGGHTHRQLHRRWRRSTVINPGSVGRPYDGILAGTRVLPWAEYAILTVTGATTAIDLRRIAVDVAQIAAIIHASGMPSAEDWVADYI